MPPFRLLSFAFCCALVLSWALPATAQSLGERLGGGFGARDALSISDADLDNFMTRYPNCIGSPTRESSGDYISPHGALGWYQIRVQDAYRAGLCADPVVQAPGNSRAWAFCDFNGPLAKHLNIKHEYDLRYTQRGAEAQKIIFIDMVNRYRTELNATGYAAPRKNEASNNPAAQSPDVMIGLMHIWGTQAVKSLLKGHDSIDMHNRSIVGSAHCLNQCLHNTFIKELKCGI